MNKSKIMYFFNAVHYMLWRREGAIHDTLYHGTENVLKKIEKKLVSEKRLKRIEAGRRKTAWFEKYMYHDYESGVHARFSEINFVFVTSAYALIIPWIILILMLSNHHIPTEIEFGIVFFAPLMANYVYFEATMFWNCQYVKYFIEFGKTDDEWRRKWKLITIAFCVIGIAVSFILGAITFSLPKS